jgi:hypothetical protein
VTPRKSAITLLHVADFGLSLRAFNVLADLKVETVSELVRLSPEELLRHQRNCGRKTVAEIEAFAHFLGVRLGSEEGLATALHFELSGARVAPSDGGFPIAWLLTVDEIPLSWRATRYLDERGSRFLGDVASLRPAGILELPYSTKALREIIDSVGRFGAFEGIDDPAWKHADPCDLAKKYQSELRSIRAELVAKKFGSDLLTSSLVEDEVRVALSKFADQRRLEMIVAWIGFDKDRDPKVADIAERAFVSRTRVYQIRVAVAKRFRRYCVPTPTLDRAIQLFEEALPASGEFIEARLRGAGLIRNGTKLRGLVRAARFFGHELDVKARRFGDRDFWARSGDAILEKYRGRPRQR